MGDQGLQDRLGFSSRSDRTTEASSGPAIALPSSLWALSPAKPEKLSEVSSKEMASRKRRDLAA